MTYAEDVDLSEAKVAWKKVLEAKAPCEWVRTTVISQSGRQIHYDSMLVRRRDGDGLMLLSAQPEAQLTPVNAFSVASGAMGKNQDYLFEVRRGQGKGDWAVQRLVPDRNAEIQEHSALIRYSLNIVQWGGLVFDQNALFPEAVELGLTTILSASPVSEEGRKLVRVEFESSVSDEERLPRSGGRLLQPKGVVYLDPSRHWTIARVEYRQDDVVTITSNEVDPKTGFLVSQKAVSKDASGHEIGSQEIRISNVKMDCGFDDNTFRLTAFGIPEPPEVAKQHVAVWLWVLAGAILIGVGVILVARRR